MREILEVLKPEILEKVKPASFSINSFVAHILETCRLAAFAKLFLLDDDLDEFLELVKVSLDIELPEKDCILAVRDFLADKVYDTKNIEEYSPYSKIIFLILQELAILKNDYKKFAQNIYQAKLLAIDIQQRELELLCDLLIGYAYSMVDTNDKALYIYEDVIQISEKAAMFNIIAIAKFFKSMLFTKLSKREEALMLISDELAVIRKLDNQAQILFAMFENSYINLVADGTLVPCDVEAEKMKLEPLIGKLKKILN
jgi:hypothetical protein